MTYNKKDFLEMLKDLQLSEQDLEDISKAGEVVKFTTLTVKRKKSKIHGYGMFTLVELIKGDIIGLASINAIHKTYLGRYTNHSHNPNIEFLYLYNYDLIAVAKHDIKKGEELTVDYRNHILTPQFYKI
tara:strand:- start:6628 stop:7014 length:387 start_codon:yes stop_codon:yes gene_type:complete